MEMDNGNYRSTRLVDLATTADVQQHYITAILISTKTFSEFLTED